jgi:tRNA (cytidine/uridine-2'-O-)-methyltransferase
MALIRLALVEPDIAGNVGTLLRLGACMGVPVDVIEPCGFPWSDRRLARAGLDYLGHADFARHADWDAFRAARPGRLVLIETDGACPLPAAHFRPGDLLLLGSETAGAPPHVRAAADFSVRIPMAQALRSLNVAVAAAMVLGEALRQLGGYPDHSD